MMMSPQMRPRKIGRTTSDRANLGESSFRLTLQPDSRGFFQVINTYLWFWYRYLVCFGIEVQPEEGAGSEVLGKMMKLDCHPRQGTQ